MLGFLGAVLRRGVKLESAAAVPNQMRCVPPHTCPLSDALLGGSVRGGRVHVSRRSPGANVPPAPRHGNRSAL